MFEFLKDNFDNSCQSMGICSLDPTVNALEELLLGELRTASFYVVKLKEAGLENTKISADIIRGLSVIMLNTSFNREDYKSFLNLQSTNKKETKERYIKHCKDFHLLCETLDFEGEDLCEKTINQLTEIGEFKSQNKYKGVTLEKQRLFELITLFAKTTSIALSLLLEVDKSKEAYNFEIIRFFALTNYPSTREEKLKRRILEFSKISYEILQSLKAANKEHFGKRKNAKVPLFCDFGKAILVSGPDLIELENVLEAIGDRKINVYTNSSMFVAHTFEKFKKYQNLKGHLDTFNAPSDFANFKGVVLLSQNFLQKIDRLYRGIVFSNKIISPGNFFKIKNNDYEPLIQAALNSEGYDKKTKGDFIEIKNSPENIEKSLETLMGKRLILIIGTKSIGETFETYKDVHILKLNCPLELDLILYIVENAEKFDISLEVYFKNCDLGSINVLMALLFKQKNNIKITNCTSALINPHVIECLNKDFNVEILS